MEILENLLHLIFFEEIFTKGYDMSETVHPNYFYNSVQSEISNTPMENITLQSMLNEFSKKNNITDKDSLKFEKFVSFSLLSNEYYDSFELENVGTGECIGVDSVAISLNDILVYAEAEAASQTKGQFEATFSFIQTKTASHLDLGDYLKFLQTVYIFFSGTEQQQPEELKEAFRIKSHIYSRASRFRLQPRLTLSYVYTGRGVIENENFEIQVKSATDSIRSLPYLFSDVESRLIGATVLADHYKETLNRMTKQLLFQRHVALPKLSSATAAYLGVTRCIDYIEILKNQDKKINKGVFYDNVRDYLGSTNPVNADIAETIKSESQRNLFSVLNNGVTVVAKRVVPSGDTFQISGFQVVNGCQTSHVLFNNRQHVTDDMYITVKLIETDDVDLSSSVIKATNSQSVVMKEAFATIKPYHKRLEDFFKAMSIHGHRFHYERRPHQYDDSDDILANEIVSAPILIKSFVSVVIEEPHKVHFYYGQILRDYNTEKSTNLFADSHHPALYFISHLIAAKVKEIAVKNKLGPWSYHIALLVKKSLKLALNLNDIMTDAKAMELIAKVNNGLAEAAELAIITIRSSGFNRNDIMIPEKTEKLVQLFFRKNSSILEKQTGPNKTSIVAVSSTENKDVNKSKFVKTNLSIKNHNCEIPARQIQVKSQELPQNSFDKISDGTYMVKQVRTVDGAIFFKYGSKEFKLKHLPAYNGIEFLPQAKLVITNGQVTKIDN